MRCLINCVDLEKSWLQEVMPGLYPHFLRILNKPLLEYFIDFCALNKIADIRIVKNDPTAEMEHYFSTGPQKGLNLSYVMGKSGDSLKKVILKNSQFCQDTDLLIIDGLFFLNYHKDQIDVNQIRSESAASMCGGAKEDIYFIPQGVKYQNLDFANSKRILSDLSITKLASVQDYYQLCMSIISDKYENYFLPGYNDKCCEFLGKNVVFNAHRSKFEKPFMIGNDVQLHDNCHIMENSIIGNHVIIDSHTTTKNSIIYDQTYLGSNLEIENKIIYKNHLIDAKSGDFIKIADKFFISKINLVLENSFFRIVQKIFALLGLILGFIPFILSILFKPLSKILFCKEEFYHNSEGGEIKLIQVKIKKANFLNRCFYRFSLDKYLLLSKVLSGKLSLVGNCALPANSYGKLVWEQLDSYHPAVISYPEVYATNFMESDFPLHEIYYNHHISFSLMLRIIFLFGFNRIFSVRRYYDNGFFRNKGVNG